MSFADHMREDLFEEDRHVIEGKRIVDNRIYCKSAVFIVLDVNDVADIASACSQLLLIAATRPGDWHFHLLFIEVEGRRLECRGT